MNTFDKIKEKLTSLKKRQRSNFPLSRKNLILASLVLILGFSLYYFRGLFVVALVNNRPITRFSFDRQLEKRYGKQELDTVIAEGLVLQEAQKEKINITQSDIDTRLGSIDNQLKSQGQSLEAYLAYQGTTKKDFEQQIKIQLIIEKILAPKIEISDKEISDYFDANKASYPKGTTLESKKDEIRNTLVRQKLDQEVPNWIAQLRQNAKILYFVNF